jgi:hypothetical protein
MSSRDGTDAPSPSGAGTIANVNLDPSAYEEASFSCARLGQRSSWPTPAFRCARQTAPKMTN